MKKLLIFLVLLSLFGCSDMLKNKQKLGNFNCPRIFFSSDISIPLYTILLDQKNEVLETQYFMILGSIKKNFENNAFTETDITDRIKIITENLDTSQIVIGFMIDDKKRLLLN